MEHVIEAQSSLAAEAYAFVKHRVLRGELAIGQVISRRKIAAELSMSFLPVSEALLRLEFEGLLESRPRAGTRVRIPSKEDVSGHYVVREALECQAAKLFATMAAASDRDALAKLAVRVDEVHLADHTQYLPVHEELHRRIAEGAQCPPLQEAIERMHALSSTWFCVARDSEENPILRHQDLVAILIDGAPDEAAEAMRVHVARSMENTMKRLKPYFKIRNAFGRTYYRSEKRVSAASFHLL